MADIPKDLSERLKFGSSRCIFYGLNFSADVWHHNGFFYGRVNNPIYRIETMKAESIEKLIEAMNKEFGHD